MPPQSVLDDEVHRGQLRFADRFADAYRGRFLHAHGIGWHQWDGARWAPCLDGAPVRALKGLLTDAYEELVGLNKVERKALFLDIQKCSSATGAKGALELAGCLEACAVAAVRLDSNPLLFNTSNGTVDLEAGKVRDPDPQDNITKVAGAAFDPDARSQLWEGFLATSLPDEEVRAFLQRLFGYALLGLVREHVLPIFTGTGANGKSVLRDAVMAAFGDYAHEVDPELLMETNHPRHGAFRMQLKGRRLIFCSETEKGRKFNESLMKRLTGGDPIEANLMRQNPIMFMPSHTLVMVTNFLPVVSGDDPAVWRRILVVPFDVVIPESERDEKLSEKLRAPDVRAAVLAWVHEGYLEYQRVGLNPPEAVRARTEEYQKESDAIARFLGDEVAFGPAWSVTAQALYERYEVWCRENGEVPLAKTVLGKELKKRNFEPTRSATTRAYTGMGLRARVTDGQDHDRSDGSTRSTYARAHMERNGESGHSRHDLEPGRFDPEMWLPGWDEDPR